MHEHSIASRTKPQNWIEGEIDDCRFQAKVFDDGSRFGINDGRVSKLMVWETDLSPAGAIINYDRGWDVEPSEDWHQELLLALLKYLEALPPRNMGG